MQDYGKGKGEILPIQGRKIKTDIKIFTEEGAIIGNCTLFPRLKCWQQTRPFIIIPLRDSR